MVGVVAVLKHDTKYSFRRLARFRRTMTKNGENEPNKVADDKHCLYSHLMSHVILLYKVHKHNFLDSESSTQATLHALVCSMARVSWSQKLYLISSETKSQQFVLLTTRSNNIAINLPIKLDSFTLLQKAAMIQEKCTKQSFSNLCWHIKSTGYL